MPGDGPPLRAYFDCLDQALRVEAKSFTAKSGTQALDATYSVEAAHSTHNLFFQIRGNS